MTKKSIVSMITGALVIGAASTTFAAANPFSDVPSDSWAYDAVSKLAADGVINGEGNGNFNGDRTITRYEMAQIVAKAMTKTDIDKADKALVDKLAAEFSEELDNLGVRVSNLEKKSDNVKWGGELKYQYKGDKTPVLNDKTSKYETGDRTNDSTYEFRLEPKVFIGNTDWTANARIRYYSNAASDNNGGSTNNGNSDKSDTTVDRIFVQGPLFGSTAKLGKLPTYSDDALGSGMIIDDQISGAEFNWKLGKEKATYVKAAVGRYDFDSAVNIGRSTAYDGTGDYTSLEIGHAAKEKGLSAVAGYYSLRNIDRSLDATELIHGAIHGAGQFADNLKKIHDAGPFADNLKKNADNDNIWAAGLGYKFSKNVNLYGIYAKSNLDSDSSYKGDSQNKAYDITLSYKGADSTKAGSWGLYTAYRYLGEYASIDPTYDAAPRGYKGWEVGGQYTVAQNILATLRYFKGKDLAADYSNSGDADFNRIYGGLEFFF